MRSLEKFIIARQSEKKKLLFSSAILGLLEPFDLCFLLIFFKRRGDRGESRQENRRVQSGKKSVFGYLWSGARGGYGCVCSKGDEGKSGCKECVCALTWGVGDACSEFILSVCSLLLCISGRELGCSTKSQEGLLDTRVINFFRVPVASVWILMLLTGLQLYRLSLKYEEALLEAPGVISWRVGANPSPRLLWLRHVKCALKIFIIILLPAHTHTHADNAPGT